MSEWDELEYGEDVFFEDIVEYVGPEETRRRVEREISRLMERFIRGSNIDVDWGKALCAKKVKDEGYDPNLWYCPGDTKPSAIAADICFSCPIREACLEFACESGERYGLFGGVPENIRSGAGAGHDRNISAYNFEKLVALDNVYDVESKKFRYHRDRLREWQPGQEYNDDNWAKWQIGGKE